MSNMSYCRFENTYRDLEDCASALEEMKDEGENLESLSVDKQRFARRLIELAQEIVNNYSDFIE